MNSDTKQTSVINLPLVYLPTTTRTRCISAPGVETSANYAVRSENKTSQSKIKLRYLYELHRDTVDGPQINIDTVNSQPLS